MEKYRVTLTAEERAHLEHTVSVGKAAARKLAHARILLLADTAQNRGHGDEDTPRLHDATPPAGAAWRRPTSGRRHRCR